MVIQFIRCWRVEKYISLQNYEQKVKYFDEGKKYMELNIGIRLVIIFPTLLFLTGYILKSIIERKNIEKIAEKELWNEHRNDFFFIVGIESLFLFVANGLIIVFELQQTELGVTTIILGIIFSLCVLVGVYSATADAGIYVLTFGLLLIFGLLTSQLAYFSSYGIEKIIFGTAMQDVLSRIGFIFGIIISYFIVRLVLSKKNLKPQNTNNSISDSNIKEVSTKDESVI
jgi:hypothetical protein